MLSVLRRNLWNWLPAFLEIAEAGSVVGAARRLALTPAAVSRTLGLVVIVAALNLTAAEAAVTY